MLKLSFLTVALAFTAIGMAQHHAKPKDKSIHHAAIHAEHWTSSHVNAPHRRFRHKYHFKKGHDRSVHHAAVHAEHWLSHHVNAPHKKPDHH